MIEENASRRDFLKRSTLMAAAAVAPFPFRPAEGARPVDGKFIQAITAVPLDGIRLNGSLGERFQKNIDYLLWRYKDADRLLFPFEHRERWLRRQDWDGEYAGKWLDAAALVAYNTGHRELIAACDDIAARLRNAQEPDGYLGTELPNNRQLPSWPHWMHWLAMKSLREHGQRFGNDASLRAAVQGGEWVLRTYHPISDESSPFYRGDGTPSVSEEVVKRFKIPFAEPKCGVLSILDELAELYSVTNNKEYLDFGAAAVAHLPLMQKMRIEGKVPPMHAYSLMSYLGGATKIAQARGDTVELSWIENAWEDIAQHHLFPTGSSSTDERLAVPPADMADGNLQETCATVEWIVLTHRLYLATGRVRYANMIELSLRNALLAAQSVDGKMWTYFTPLTSLYGGKPWFGGPTDCCYFSGPRGIARIPTLLYHMDKDGVRIDLFENSMARLMVNSDPVTIVQETEYPAVGLMRLRLEAEHAKEFTIKLRLPEHSVDASLQVNGRQVRSAARSDNYLSIRRTWRTGDTVELRFTPQAWISTMSDGSAVIMRGSEALALDRRDNAVDLEQIGLLQKVEVRPAEKSTGGRMRYHCDMTVAGVPKAVVLTPFAEAGNTEVGMAMNVVYRTAFPKGKELADYLSGESTGSAPFGERSTPRGAHGMKSRL